MCGKSSSSQRLWPHCSYIDCGHLCRVSQFRCCLEALALPCVHCRNIWVSWYLQAGWEETARLGQTYKIHQFWLDKVSGNFSNSLICFRPKKNLFSARQSIFLFPSGQDEPIPQTCSWTGAGCLPGWQHQQSGASGGWAGPFAPHWR